MNIFHTDSWITAEQKLNNFNMPSDKRYALAIAISAALLAEPIHEMVELQKQTLQKLEDLKKEL